MNTDSSPQSLPAAQALAVAGLIEVAPGAIVSRTLMRNKAGTVTLFAFDEGQGLSEHSAPFDALVQVVDGALTLTIGGEVVQAGGGDMVLMPADVPHGIEAREPSRMVLVMLKG